MVLVNEVKDKVSSLYEYIKQLCLLKYKYITDINNQRAVFYFKDFPISEYITINYKDRFDNKEEFVSDTAPIITIQKPEFQICPPPPNVIKNWLNSGWDNYNNEVSLKDSINDDLFADSEARIQSLASWKLIRKDWIDKQKIIKKIRDLFNSLRNIEADLKKENEDLELVIGNGFITKNNDKSIHHPILLKPVNITYDAKNNSITISDVEKDSELYLDLLLKIDSINMEEVRGLQNELKDNFYHPLDRNETYDFFKILIHKIHNNGIFEDGSSKQNVKNIDEDYLTITPQPVLILRKRNDGALKALDYIVEDIKNNRNIPPYIVDITNGGRMEIPETFSAISIDEQLAATSGESSEILLPLNANKEQLEIAQRIERYNAVIVQGPPGTGKTHTIANLLAHFLAPGKNVLITSHTKKALSVLKDKIPLGSKSLCVSLLDASNKDMERSIDGIADYLSRYTSRELLYKIDRVTKERESIIKELASVRRQIFAVRNKESENIVYDGKGYSTIEVADFVRTNETLLSEIIPGSVELNKPFPLTDEELNNIYMSNSGLTKQEENEIHNSIPNPEDLITPANLSELKTKYNNAVARIKALEKELSINVKVENNKILSITKDGIDNILIENLNPQNLVALQKSLGQQGHFEPWMKQAIADGLSHQRSRWLALINKLESAVKFTQAHSLEYFEKKVVIAEPYDIKSFVQILSKLKDFLNTKKKVSKIDYFFHPDFKTVMKQVTINGNPISTPDDCLLVINYIKSNVMRKDISTYWDLLLAVNGEKKFMDLGEEPEIIAKNLIPKIKKYLDWFNNDYKELKTKIEQTGFKYRNIFVYDDLASDKEKISLAINFMFNDLPKYISLAQAFIDIEVIKQTISNNKNILSKDSRKKSEICSNLLKSLLNWDTEHYNDYYFELTSIYSKIELANQREALLNKIHIVAPQWSFAIENRIGQHGGNKCPQHIKSAWKWKQFNGIIENIINESLDKKLTKCNELSNLLKSKTVELAEVKAWYYLLQRSEADLDLRQALKGWKETVKQIGKGTGKKAKSFRKYAREQMTKCQKAVPAWIMTISSALGNLTPGENIFDVVIIDEASQADISALAVCYMGKKLIIVGDDKQVSPSSIGISIEQTDSLLTTYLKNKIPNWHLYNSNSSLYDIAGTTFQPLMLREHFRCVPDIIGYSNKLSYDFKIKPLREASSSNLLPAVINYRVEGYRKEHSKINETEADTIVSLIQACIEQYEYKNMTFGVISLLGDEQVDLITRKIFDRIDISEYESRKILCGNASNFQGDERDVIFLSMVDSNDLETPLSLKSDGANNSTKQRYKVATSRAKNQMWLVHSLDVSKDLKDGDIRRDLIEYTINPKSFTNRIEAAKQKSDSIFEQEVFEYLTARNYHIEQQWQVGAYRIDMVALYKEHKIAIECDGTRFHSGEDKVRQDMERQTILERVGWKFIRIRGSEYFRDKTQTMASVVKQLNSFGILPEKIITREDNNQTSELFERVKNRAFQIREAWKLEDEK